MKCFLIACEGKRPEVPPAAATLSSNIEVVSYGKFAYIVGAEDMTIDNVMKLFGLCGNNQPSALVVEMATYRGCAMADVVAERISSLLHK